MHEIIIGWGFMSAWCRHAAAVAAAFAIAPASAMADHRPNGPAHVKRPLSQVFSTAPVFALADHGATLARWSWLDASRAPWVMAADDKAQPSLPRGGRADDALAEGEPAT